MFSICILSSHRSSQKDKKIVYALKICWYNKPLYTYAALIMQIRMFALPLLPPIRIYLLKELERSNFAWYLKYYFEYLDLKHWD